MRCYIININIQKTDPDYRVASRIYSLYMDKCTKNFGIGRGKKRKKGNFYFLPKVEK